MRPNSTSSQITGDQGFARRRMNDIAGLAAILGTAFVISLVVGVQTPLFAVVLFAAVGALAYAEQRYNGAGSHRVSTGGIARRVHHA
jgi:uncharacterized membrane protein YphA (DoxX/SURF4 family)